MRLFQTLLGVGLILVLVSSSSEAAKASGKRNRHAVRGTVETVTADSMVVKVRQGKKKGGEPADLTFQLNAATLYEFVTIKKHAKGEKPEIETKPATLSDLKPGERVQIAGPSAATEKVSILQGARGGKKKTS